MDRLPFFVHINYPNYPVYISQSPTNDDIEIFINQINNNKIKHIVRLCECLYDSKKLSNLGISFYDWEFNDGMTPPQYIIDNWINLLKLNEPILIHCRAGLGRAPILATIGLIEKNVDPYDSIEIVRKLRPKALNKIQIDFLLKYKPKNKKLNSLKSFFNFCYR